MAGNHINSMEAPVMISHLMSHPLTVVTKITNMDKPYWSFFLKLWKSIPLHPGEGDWQAFRDILQALDDKQLVAILPEGTRSRHGRMQKGFPGIVLIALRSKAPILPMVFHGHENYIKNMRRLKRSDFNIRVGNPFHLNANGHPLSREVREQMITEIMYQIASLLPPAYRGVYSNLKNATSEFLEFEEGIQNNLDLAPTA